MDKPRRRMPTTDTKAEMESLEEQHRHIIQCWENYTKSLSQVPSSEQFYPQTSRMILIYYPEQAFSAKEGAESHTSLNGIMTQCEAELTLWCSKHTQIKQKPIKHPR